MILTDGVNTSTYLHERIKETPIQNSNIDLTIGFSPKIQADAQRLKIETVVRVPQSEYALFNSILTNYGAVKYYTPARLLAYKSAIEEMQVVISEAAQIDQRAWNGEIIFWIRLMMEEVDNL